MQASHAMQSRAMQASRARQNVQPRLLPARRGECTPRRPRGEYIITVLLMAILLILVRGPPQAPRAPLVELNCINIPFIIME
jgi:hypothetical protein